jgi:cyclophilin family peptidyl-prolyl cis-trans isomerase/HEAT repeat protein
MKKPQIFKYWAWMALASWLCVWTGCVPPDDSTAKQTIRIDLADKKVQQLFEFQDRRMTDSLVQYFKHPNATLRYIAALSFGSSRDSSVLTELISLLSDNVEDVRIAAAYSLGQIGAKKAELALTAAFDSGDSLSQHQRFNATVLEAIGKCGTKASLRNLIGITTYRPTDTLLLLGQCRAIYRYGYRDSIEPAGTALMVKYVSDQRLPESARLMAAHYLARTKNIAPDSAQAMLLASAFVRSSNSDIRMALATGIGKSKTGPAFAIISKVIGREEDWRVQCNLIKALAGFQYDTVRALIRPLLFSANPHVSSTAATFFIDNGQPKDGDYYWRITKDNPALGWQTVIALFQASNRWLSGKTDPESKDFVNYRLREIFQQSKNPYERAACLTALSEFVWNYRYIYDKGLNDAHPAVKSAAAAALTTIVKKSNFYALFGEGATDARRELYYQLKSAIVGGDPGVITEAAPGLATSAIDYRPYRDSNRIKDLTTALQNLRMPRDVEAQQALQKTLAWFEDRPEPKVFEPIKPNHPIDWSLLATLVNNKGVLVQTSKGPISLELMPGAAPGSVANFIRLVKDGFYNGKNFHRVVSNFVVQGGCPRGDGYGALDYTLRTETSLQYYDAAGYVGMASAGLDTEGTQWFITHAPTPHLDGRYTIFAKVTGDGMKVVDQLQIGDVIESVRLQ